jgi:ATP-dependent helicase HrpA
VNRESKVETLKQLLPQCLLADQVRIGSRLAEAMAAARRGGAAALPLERWLAEAKASAAIRRRRGDVLRQVEYPAELPITPHREAIVAALRKHPVVIVAGETGSGKTTQLPKMCLEAGLGMRARIGCTQPRRVAALSISRRLAEELRVNWGQEVGCKIRFSDNSRPETSIKVMTDGILLAEVQGEPLLSEYEAIILDEAHERSLNIDFLLGYLRLLLERRDDLKLIITSATLDTELFSQAFNHAPVIEVSGRLYTVEVRYCPLAEQPQQEGELTYIDAAVGAVESLLAESRAGDALVFMPGERDIRETCDRLEDFGGKGLEIVPLFGRLTAAEQQRVFAPGPKRRVVVATNIAETSLTVPRIRYVIDTGLARISRYHPGTRSRRLPVEPISQSSANQRQGRCGRVADGVCVRLYSEADFQARPLYTQPEIQRCNLADVILRIKAYRLGDVETFPFVEPPSPKAIRSAYELLQELGALDEQRQLTALGCDLARLPVEPAIGRMLLQAQRENALREVLVIAAGLSIQDPRERPFDRQDAAEAAHRRFHHPRSDFLALLNIWNAYHDTWESLPTQNQLRKFCKAHFLSFARMREWRDVQAQLQDALEDLGALNLNAAPADYEAIHRSILTGLWGHVAERAERNIYRLPGNRDVLLFPGSGLFDQSSRHRPARSAAAPPAPSEPANKQPPWIVAGEVVETSRPYARAVAEIAPQWVIELAPHLCRHSYDQARWDRQAGRVLARERVRLGGLVLRERQVPYARVHPEDATQIFIRSALVEEDLPGNYLFVQHNHQMRQKLDLWQTRVRPRGAVDLAEALFEFYTRRLQRAASLPDLDRALKSKGDPNYLCAQEADLLGERAGEFDGSLFPDAVPAGEHAVAVAYAYAPGEERDGVTLRLAVPLMELVDPGQLEWAVPALREERVLELLRLLPKTLRRPLLPLDAAAREIVRGAAPESRCFLAAMSAFVRHRYGVDVPVSAWPLESLPPHLRPRYEIAGRDQQTLAAGRDFKALRAAVQRHDTPAEIAAWQQAVHAHERYGLAGWVFGDLPEQILVTEVAGFPLVAYPALQVEAGAVNLRLFRRQEEAADAHPPGVARLAELALQRELTGMQHDLCALRRLRDLYVGLGPPDELAETAWENIRFHLFPEPRPPPRTVAAFEAYVQTARQKLPGLASRFVTWVGAVLQKRHEAAVSRHLLPQFRVELAALVPPQFLRHIPFAQLEHVPRYLQALLIRAERAGLNPAKDAEKARRVQPYADVLQNLRAKAGGSAARREQVERFACLVEEFKVSCFAQELGTAMPVSAKRLEAALAELVDAAG